MVGQVVLIEADCWEAAAAGCPELLPAVPIVSRRLNPSECLCVLPAWREGGDQGQSKVRLPLIIFISSRHLPSAHPSTHLPIHHPRPSFPYPFTHLSSHPSMHPCSHASIQPSFCFPFYPSIFFPSFHLPIHPFTRHSRIHILYSPSDSLTYPHTYSPTYSSTHPSICPLFLPSFPPSLHSFLPQSTCLSTHLLTYPSSHPFIHPLIHPSICPS